MYQETCSVPGLSKPWRIISFDSISEFTKKKPDYRNCENIWNESVAPQMNNPAQMREWFGCDTKEEFFEIIEKGHKKYVDMVREKTIEFKLPESLRRKKIWSEEGDELDIHQVRAGNISKAWRSRSRKMKTSNKNIRLLVNTCNHCGISADELTWIGVAALQATEAFEAAGYRIAIDAILAISEPTSEESVSMVIPVKEYDAPVDVQSLTAMLCFPGFFRGPGFMNIGICKGSPSMGLGRPMEMDFIKTNLVPKIYMNPDEVIVLIPNSVLSKNAAESFITGLVQTFGTRLEGAAA